MNPVRLAVIVGHTATAGGLRMVRPLAVPEYFWNLAVAERMAFEARTDESVRVKVFLRDVVGLTRTYKAVNLWNPDCSIELHCNGFDGTARGTETLFTTKNPGSLKLATMVQGEVAKLFEHTGKQDRGVKSLQPTDRGYWNTYFADCPSCLVEPFFGDNLEDAQRAKLVEDEYPVILLGILKQFAEGLKNGGTQNNISGPV